MSEVAPPEVARLPEDDPLIQLRDAEAEAEAGPNQPPRPGQPPLDDPENPDPNPEPDEEEYAEEEPEGEPQEDPAARWEAERADLYKRLGSMANEIGHLRKVAEQPQAQAQQAESQPVSAADIPDEQIDAWVEQYGYGPTMKYIASLEAAGIAQMMQEEFNQQIAPLRATSQETAAARAVEMLKQDVGDDLVMKHKDILAEAIKERAGEFSDPASRHRRMKEVIYAAEFEATRPQGQAKPDRPRSQNGRYAPKDSTPERVHTEGGSSPAPAPQGDAEPDAALHPADHIKWQMSQVRPRFDALGELPYIPPGT